MGFVGMGEMTLPVYPSGPLQEIKVCTVITFPLRDFSQRSRQPVYLHHYLFFLVNSGMKLYELA